MICWKCHSEITIEKIFRTSECSVCGADLHVCKQCRFYSTGIHFECKENITDPVVDKEKNNFCDFYMADEVFSGALNDSKVQKARNAAAALFGEAPSTTSNDAESAKNAFNSLFGD